VTRAATRDPAQRARVAQQRRLRPILGKVVDADNEPVSDATVYVRWRVHPELPGLTGVSLGDHGLDERTLAVDKRGRFRFQPPHGGPFLVVARADGHSSPQEFPAMAGHRCVLRLEPNHMMAGVVLAAGKPLAGARVRLVPESQTWFRLAMYRLPERRATATTDASGRFRLLFEHGYLRAPRWGSFFSPWVDSDSLSNTPPRIVRPDKASTKLSVGLGAGQYLRGVVIDATTTKPIAGARVVDPLLSRSEVRTDEHGRYAALLPLGEVWVTAPGYAPIQIGIHEAVGQGQTTNVALVPGVELAAVLVGADDGPLSNARVLFAVSGTRAPFEWTAKTSDDGSVKTRSMGPTTRLTAYVEVDGVFVRFYRGSERGNHDLGRVTVRASRTIQGRVRSSGNERIAGARVALFAKDNRNAADMRITYTDRTGDFRFDAVLDEPLTLGVEAGTNGFARVEVPAGPTTRPIDVHIPEGKTVSGRVLDPEGKPVAGAWVTCWSRSAAIGIPGPSASNMALVALTDQNGAFRFRGLPSKAGWLAMSRYLRDGVYWRATAPAKPGVTVELKSYRAVD